MMDAPADDSGYSPVTLDDLEDLERRLDVALKGIVQQSFDPNSSKVLRSFTLSDVCELLDLHPTVFYEIARAHPDLAGTKDGHQRLFKLAEVHRLQAHLGRLPRQLYDIRRAVSIAVAGFKGGSSKTQTSVLLAQYLARAAHRVLLIDIDPQSSAGTIHGVDPTVVDDWNTILPILYGPELVKEWSGAEIPPFRESIQPTYWAGLDIVHANLSLYSGEFALSIRRHSDPSFKFHMPLAEAIEQVRADYDVIIFDTPPALSLTTSAALYAADALIMPLPAEMLDFASGKSFIQLTKEILSAIRTRFTDEKQFDFFKVLVTKFQTNNDNQMVMANRIREVYGRYFLPEPMVQTTAIQKAGKDVRTLYEMDPRAPGRAVLKRALESADAVNRLLEAEIIKVYKHRRALRAAADVTSTTAAA